MTDIKFYIPPEQRQRWQKALVNASHQTKRSADLLRRIEACADQSKEVIYSHFDPLLTQVFAQLMKPDAGETRRLKQM